MMRAGPPAVDAMVSDPSAADGPFGTENLEDLVAIQTAALAEVAKQEQQAQESERSRSPAEKKRRRSRSRDRNTRGGRDRGGGDRGGDRRRERDRGRDDGPRRRPTYVSIPGAKRNKMIRYDCCVFLSNIDYKVTWQELKDVLKRHVGDVGYVELFTNPDGTSKGCAFVEFKNREDSKKALTNMDRFEIHNRKLVIKEDSEGRHSEKFFHQREAEEKAKSILTPQLLSQLNLDPNNLCDTVFVANLPYDVSWRKLKDVFKMAGPVARVEVMEDKGRSRGMATVQFETNLSAVQAICMFDGQTLYDRRMAVRMDKEKVRASGGANEPPPRPPPLPSGLSSIGPSLESLAGGGGGGGGGMGLGGMGGSDSGYGGSGGGGGGGGSSGGLPQGLGGIGSGLSSMGGGSLGGLDLGNLGRLGGGGGLGGGLSQNMSHNLSQNLGSSLGQGLGQGLGGGGLGGSLGLGGHGLGGGLGLGALGGLGSLGSGSGIGLGGSDLGRSNNSGLGLSSFDLGMGSSSLGGGSLLGGDLDRDFMGLQGGLYGGNDHHRNFMDDRNRDRNGGGGGGGVRDRYRDRSGDRGGDHRMDRRDRDRGDRDRDRGDRDRGGDRGGERRGGGGGGVGGRGGRGGGEKGLPKEGGTQVFIRNLPFAYTWQKLKDVFKNVGPVTFASVKTDERGQSRGFGTVRFETSRDAQNAINLMSGTTQEGRQIEVSLDCY